MSGQVCCGLDQQWCLVIIKGRYNVGKFDILELVVDYATKYARYEVGPQS